MAIEPATPDMLNPDLVEKQNRATIYRDIDLIHEKLEKYAKWERKAPMFMSFEEWKEYRAIEEEYSGLVLSLLVDEVTLDSRYLNNKKWSVRETLLDLIRRGLAVKE